MGAKANTVRQLTCKKCHGTSMRHHHIESGPRARRVAQALTPVRGGPEFQLRVAGWAR